MSPPPPPSACSWAGPRAQSACWKAIGTSDYLGLGVPVNSCGPSMTGTSPGLYAFRREARVHGGSRLRLGVSSVVEVTPALLRRRANPWQRPSPAASTSPLAIGRGASGSPPSSAPAANTPIALAGHDRRAPRREHVPLRGARSGRCVPPHGFTAAIYPSQRLPSSQVPAVPLDAPVGPSRRLPGREKPGGGRRRAARALRQAPRQELSASISDSLRPAGQAHQSGVRCGREYRCRRRGGRRRRRGPARVRHAGILDVAEHGAALEAEARQRVTHLAGAHGPAHAERLHATPACP